MFILSSFITMLKFTCNNNKNILIIYIYFDIIIVIHLKNYKI